MDYLIIKSLLLISLILTICVILLILIRFSDQSKIYREFTALNLIPLFIFVLLHLYVHDPFRLYDNLTHLFGGLMIFLLFSNLPFKKENREKISLFMVLLFIVLMEIFLSITEYQQITYDIIVDLIITSGGGIIGDLLYKRFDRIDKNDLLN